MSTVLDPVSTDKSTEPPGMVHIFYPENPNVTLCGGPVTEIVDVSDEKVDCVVCIAIFEHDCEQEAENG